MSLPKPLGIAFEEVVAGQGVVVDYLVEESNAEKCGKIQPGDILIAVTAFKVPSMSTRLPVYRSVCLPTYQSIHPCIHPCIHLSTNRLSTHLLRRPRR